MSWPPRLQFAAGCGYGTARGANRRGHAAEDTHDQSEENAHPKKIKGDLKGEGQVGKSLKIYGAGGQAVQGQNGEAAKETASKRNQKGFKEKGEDDVPGVEAERAHGGNFTAAFGDGGVHGVEVAKNRTKRHDPRYKTDQNGDELGHACGLFGVVVDFASYVHIQTPIGGECILQLLKGGRRSEVHGNGLRKSFGPRGVGCVEETGVAPNFGIKRTATRIESADDLPTCATEPNCVSQR